MDTPTKGATLLRREIYRLLHQEIISCKLAPGQDLREQDLAERFEISRSPVRDALLQLEFEGLIQVHPRRGYRVAPITRPHAEELYDMRALLEREIVRMIIERCPEERLQAFQAQAALPTGTSVDFVAYNRQFHLSLARLTGHDQLSATSARIISQFDRLITLTLPRLNLLKMHELESEHRSIVDALSHRDMDKALILTARHIDGSRDRVLSALDDIQQSGAALAGNRGDADQRLMLTGS